MKKFPSRQRVLTLKGLGKKMHLKMSSADVISDKLSIEANSVDPGQTAPMGAV